MTYSRIFILLFIVALASLYMFTDISTLITLESIQAQQAQLRDAVAERPLLSGVLFATVYTGAVAFSLPFATVLTLLGGALFGFILGTLLVVSSATLGASVVFLLTKTAFGEVLRRKIENSERSKKLLKELEENGFNYLLFLRFVPVFPFFVVNIAPAFVGMRLKTYVAATFLGIFPGTAIFVNVGQSLADVTSLGDILSPQIFMAFGLLGLFALTPTLIKKLRNSK